jgi:hypothetical protein
MNLTDMSYQTHDRRGDRKRSKPQNSMSDGPTSPNITGAARSPRVSVGDGVSTLDAWSTPRYILLARPSPTEMTRECEVVPDQSDSTYAPNV